ncbi:hypothetical protein [Paraburkholderia sp. 40]|uniref:hypothetical protein n=1 Tax=Paraburkholderia sp. 40 TaxID=2991059 RepID=UPI003D23FA64
MTVELGKGLGVGGVNPFEQTQETAKPADAPKVAKDTNPFRNGMFGDLKNMAKAATGGESQGLRFGAQLPGLRSNNPFAKPAEAAMSLFGKTSPVGMAVSTVANAALNHLGPTSTLGQMGNIAQHAATQGTNELLNNAEDAMDLSQLQSSADQNMQLTNAASRIQTQVKFNDIMANMNVKAWDTIKQMFDK